MTPHRSVSSVVAAVLVLGASNSLAQRREPSDAAIDRAVERILHDADTERDETDMEELWQMRENPIDLLSASPYDLAALPGISLQDAINIISVVDALQPSSFAALADSSTIPVDQIMLLRAFTRLGQADRRSESGHVRCRLSQGLQAARGERESVLRVVARLDPASETVRRDTISIGPPFKGAPHSMLVGAQMQKGDFTGGFLLESDRYEPLFLRDSAGYTYRHLEEVDADSIASPPGAPRYTGFASLHATFRNRWVHVAAGDFTVGYGQGLVFGGATGPVMTDFLTDGSTSPVQGLKPYRSSGESGFRRGLGIELTRERILGVSASLTLFSSWSSLDASIETINHGADSGRALVLGIRDDGLRRTISEVRRSANATERTTGAALTVAGFGWRVGATWGNGTLRPASTGGIDHRWELFSIHGQRGDRSESMYAELATSGESIAGLAGYSATLASTELAVSVGWWPASFESPHAEPAPLSGLAPGRSELAIALRHPFPQGAMTLQTAIGRRFVVSPTNPFPSWGAAGQLSTEYRLTPEFVARLRVTCGRTLDGTRTEDAIGRTRSFGIERNSISVRCGLEYAPADEPLTMRARIERRVVEYESQLPPATAWLAHLLARGEPIDGLALSASFVLHNVRSAAARLAVAFSDVPGRTLSHALYGSGRSLNLSARYRFPGEVTVALSYTEDRRTDVDSMRSGLDTIESPLASSLTLQIDVPIGEAGRRRARD